MENTGRKKIKKGVPRGNTAIFAIMVSNLIILLGRLLFSGLLDEIGLGYYAAVYEMFVFILLILSWYIPQAEAKVVRARIAKGQFKNADRVLKATLMFGGGIGLVLCLLEVALAKVVAEKLLLQPLTALALWIIAPAILLSIFISAYRGYFEGMGTTVPTNISRILEQIFALGFGLIFGRTFYNYGEKIGDLVQNINYAPAYAVAGIICGIVMAQLFVLLFLIFINRMYASTFKKQLSKDNSKILDSYSEIMKNVFLSGIPHIFYLLLVQGIVYVNMLLYIQYVGKNTMQNYTVPYGSFYGIYCVIIGICVCLLSLTMEKPLAAITHYHKREEYRAVKDIFAGAFHTFGIYGIPMSVFLAALAEPITNMFFEKANGTVFLLQVSSSLIFLIPCALFFTYTLQLLGKQRKALINCAVAFSVQLVATMLFLHVMHFGIASVAYGYMICFGLMAILNGMSVLRYLKYSPEYIRMFAIPLLASGIAGILDMLLARAMLEKAGGMITSIVCIILGCIGYVALLFALKGVNEKELSKISGGKWLGNLGKILHLF